MLKKLIYGLIPAIILFGLTAGSAQAEVKVGVSIDKDGISGFYLAIGEHYDVPEKEIVIVREKKVPDEELPVIFHIARHAGVSHLDVIKLRLKGLSWIDITFHFGLTAEIFYVPIKHKPGPPYGKAWGHFKKGKKGGWQKVRLDDSDIVNYVNLRFLTIKYGYTAEAVIKMRANGDSFVNINGKIKKAKHKKKAHKMASHEPGSKPGKGKGKNK